MKKILSLALLTAALLGASTADAQVKKMWDFTKGFSDATKLDLNADPTNWTANRTDDAGVVYGWKNATAQTGLQYANGNVISELAELKFSNFKAGHILLDATSIRLGTKSQKVQLPKLANGQTVTIVARSANSSATDRALISYTDDLKYISGPDQGICYGSATQQCTDADNGGNWTLVWQVQTESADSIDITIGTWSTNGGIDIKSIMIDNGDEAEIETDPSVAYICIDPEADFIRLYELLGSHVDVTDIAYGKLLSGEVSQDSLMTFDAVVLSPMAVYAMGSDFQVIQDMLNYVPILNLTPCSQLGYTYVSTDKTALTVPEDLLDDDLFADIPFEEEDGVFSFTLYNGENLEGCAYMVDDDNDFADDVVYATLGTYNAIHAHGNKNQYMLIPINYSALENGAEPTDACYTLLANAINVIKKTKGSVLTASRPSVSFDYTDGVTTATLKSSIAGSKIYYTTDGTEPTKISTRYTEALSFTEPCTLKAFVTAPAYYDSPVTEAEVVIKRVLAAPSVSTQGAEGSTTVTLSTSAAEASIYYSFNGQTDAAKASLYDEPIVLTEPATITAFAYADGFLASETTVADIYVGGIPAVKDTVAHFTANEADWFTAAVIKDYELTEQPTPEANWAAKAAYYWGKSAWNYYGTEVDYEEVVTDEEGNPIKSLVNPEQDSILVVYKADPTAVKYVYSTADTQWRMRTQGQVLTGETNVAATETVNNDPSTAGYYAETAQDLIGAPSKGKLTFGAKISGEPYTASVESTEKFQAPFDVVTYLTNGGTGEPGLFLQTSVDGENWESVGQLTNAKTQRYYRKDRFHVEGTESLYVRVAQLSGSTKAQLYDIYVISTEGMTGIEQIAADADVPGTSLQYDLYGRQLQAPVRGQLFIQNGKKMIIR